MKSILTLFALFTLAVLTSGCAGQAGAELGGQSVSGSVLEQGVNRHRNLIDVRLAGANEGVLTEIFGKVVVSAPTVLSATRYSSQIVPDNPQACWLLWRVRVDDSGDGFRLQTDMMDMLQEINRAGGYLDLYGVPYRYSRSEIGMLKGIRPGDATSRSLQFVVDRELARDREMAGQ